MKHPVLAIGLDAAEPDMIEAWIAQGRLPNIAKLWQSGAYGRLENYDMFKAELPWTTFLSGVAPEKTGYWSQLKFDPKTYGVANQEAYAFDEYKPFYALGENYRVAVFDPPQGRIVDRVNGVQAFGWGAHSAQTPRASSPEAFIGDVISRHGNNPGFEKDHFEVWDVSNLEWLRSAMRDGIRRRTAICRDLLNQERWDLLLTVYGEPHSVGHCHYHLSCPDHPLYERCRKAGEDPFLEVFEEIDRGIGELVEAAPAETRVVLFSMHGTASNALDVPSMLFLPELLYRYSFPGRTGFAAGATDPLPPMELGHRKWADEIWSRRTTSDPLRRLARKHLGLRSWRLERFIGSGPGPAHPVNYGEFSWMPAQWYANLWPEMKAFALPSFSDGYIRINQRGREQNGIVDPADFDRVCDEIVGHLEAMRNPRNGRPLVREITRLKERFSGEDEREPDADMIVLWDPEPADVVDSPTFGRFGPVPLRRSGGHTMHGFISLTGPGIPAGKLPNGDGIDVPPTILHAMEASRPNHLDGQSLLTRHLESGGRAAATG